LRLRLIRVCVKDRSGILFSVLLIEVEMRSEKDIADSLTRFAWGCSEARDTPFDKLRTGYK